MSDGKFVPGSYVQTSYKEDGTWTERYKFKDKELGKVKFEGKWHIKDGNLVEEITKDHDDQIEAFISIEVKIVLAMIGDIKILFYGEFLGVIDGPL